MAGRGTPRPREGEPVAAQTPPGLRRDGVVLVLFAELLVLLVAGLEGWSTLFAYTLVLTLGTFVALGFVRRGDPLTWVSPVLATLAPLAGMIGVLSLQDRIVDGTGSTVLGFHPATAFLVYLIWIPGFFTVGLAYTLAFDRLYGLATRRRAPGLTADPPVVT